MAIVIDEMLHGNRRRLRTCPDKILMDANGLRLWADYMDVAPGFSGRIDFIHKINIPGLFFVDCWRKPGGVHTAGEMGQAEANKATGEREQADQAAGNLERVESYEPAKIQWEPDNVCLHWEQDGIVLTEHKFITEEDAAVSCMVWENRGAEPFEVRLRPGTQDGTFETTYGAKLAVSFFCNGEELQPLHAGCTRWRSGAGEYVWSVGAGETLRLCVAALVCLRGENARMRERSAKLREKFRDPDEALANQKRQYQKWFDQAPGFRSSDPVIDRTWAYRWYIYRHNLMRPELGNLRETFFCEGRSHKMTKTPYQPEGWEFTKLIPLSVPLHFLDLRWYGDKSYGTSVLHVMRDNQDEAGEFHCAKVDWQGNPYANFFGWAVWQYYLVSGDLDFAREALPVVRKQAEGWQERYGNASDSLLTQYVHQLTGMEYQPSYWYFQNFPEDCRDSACFTPLKRVDRNVYHCLNTLAVSKLCELCGDTQADYFREWSDRIRRDILEKMWDDGTGFFYDLHYRTDEKAFVKNIVGVFPFFGGVAGEDHRRCLEILQSAEFDTEWPFPSVSTECPVYSAEGGWQGHFFKGRNGCIWNGPSWPFANSLVLDALGQESQRSGHSLDEAFRKYFLKYTQLHYCGGDGELPYLVEHYNSRTGECISDDVDYSHSCYINLVVRYLTGIIPDEDMGRLTVDPLNLRLSWFALTGLRVRGHLVDVTLEKESGLLTVTVDGKIAAQRRGLGRLEVCLEGGGEEK